jgi:hypothetical protein
MYENLHYEAEDILPTDHPRVMRTTGEAVLADTQGFLERLQTIVAARDPHAALRLLGKTFETFQFPKEAQVDRQEA